MRSGMLVELLGKESRRRGKLGGVLGRQNRTGISPVNTVKFSSVAQSYPTLCNPMDCSMPGFPVHHQLLELTQTQVH